MLHGFFPQTRASGRVGMFGAAASGGERRQRPSLILRIAIAANGCLAAALLVGCGGTQDLHLAPYTAYPTAPKIDASAQLRLPQWFLDFHYDRVNEIGPNDRFPLGTAAKGSAEAMANALFRESRVAMESERATGASVDIVLRPRSAKAEEDFALNRVICIIEWIAEDPAGTLVWKQKIRGANAYSWFWLAPAVQESIDVTFRRSFDAIAASTEIREYIRQRRAAAEPRSLLQLPPSAATGSNDGGGS